MRRWFAVCSVLALLLTVAGCDNNNTAKRLSDAHTEAEQLESQINDLKDKLAELQSEVDRFDDENWRDVVPEVRSKVSDLQGDCEMVSDAAGTLTAELDTLDSEANDPGDQNDY